MADITRPHHPPTRLKFGSFPGRGLPNPYVDLYCDAIARRGFELVSGIALDSQYCSQLISEVDLLHFHWPEALWRQYGTEGPSKWLKFARDRVPGGWRLQTPADWVQARLRGNALYRRVQQLVGLSKFKGQVLRSKRNGLKIIWTIHNIESHEGGSFVDRTGYRYLARHADLLIFHSESAEAEFCARYHSKALPVIMPHGNYDGIYPEPRARLAVLSELGLRTDLPVISCLGAIRGYKGLEVACEAAAILGDQVQFLCAGAPHRDFNLVNLKEAMTKLRHSALVPEYLSDQRFSDLVAASDVVLLPYNRITGSGALLAALTLSRGVVASDLPYFREVLAGENDAGRLVPPGDSTALARGINQFLQVPKARRDAAARRLADRFSWERVAEPVIEVLERWAADKRR